MFGASRPRPERSSTTSASKREIAKLEQQDRLYQVVRRFCEIDLHPDVVDNHEMGTIFEELIRRFSEQANEESGDHFTPREVIRLMVNLLFAPDAEVLTRQGIVRTLFDPACGARRDAVGGRRAPPWTQS